MSAKKDNLEAKMEDKTIFGSNKILQHLDRIKEYKELGNTSPITMEIDMTDACHHKCPGCVGGTTWNGNRLTGEEAKDYVTQMAKAGVKGLTFTGGGEPLINKETVEVVKHASDLGIDVGVITNGGLLSKQKANDILKYATWLRVSLDGADEKTYNMIHGKDKKEFDTVLKNLWNAGKIKNNQNSKCTLGVGYLTDERTIPGMYAAASSLSQYPGLDYLQFRPFHGSTDNIAGKVQDLRSKFETDDFKILASTQKYSHFGEKEWFADGQNARPYKKCHGASFVGVLQANADITVCCHTRGKDDYVVGNLRQESFEDVWFGAKKKKIIEDLNLRTCGPRYCRSDGFNRTLEDVMTPKDHQNFL